MALSPLTSTYRLLIVAAALLGVLVVTHLSIEAGRGFANGCTGLAASTVTFDPTAPTEAAGCGAVTQGEYADFLGVSNIIWGLVFYGILVALRLGYAASGQDRVRLAAFAVSGAGVLYAAYLVYLQGAVIGQWCPLCLISSTLVLTLFVLHLLEARRLRTAAAVSAPRRAASGLAALRPYAPILVLFTVLLGTRLALAGNADAAEGAATPPLTTDVATPTSLGGLTDPAVPVDVATCAFDPAIAPIADLSPFTTGPFKGSSADGAVTVIKVFDPNCPHCRDLSDALVPVIEAEGGRARFHYVAYPLRQESVAQVIALKVAQREGKFFELMDEMFRRQDASWGMSLPELAAAVTAVGMDGAALEALLKDTAAVQPILIQVQAEAAAVSAAFATPDGGISVPKLAVGNRVVAATAQSYTSDCLAEFISRAAAPAAPAPAP